MERSATNTACDRNVVCPRQNLPAVTRPAEQAHRRGVTRTGHARDEPASSVTPVTGVPAGLILFRQGAGAPRSHTAHNHQGNNHQVTVVRPDKTRRWFRCPACQ